MTNSVKGNPDTFNLLSPNSFRFTIRKLPNVSYFCQEVEIPSISMPETMQPTPLHNIPLPGSKMVFAPLTIKFKVDADLANYKEMYNWMTGLGHPDSFDQTKALSLAADIPGTKIGAVRTLVSDATLIITTAKKNPFLSVTFTSLFPISLSGLNFSTTISDINYINAEATFRYTHYVFDN